MIPLLKGGTACNPGPFGAGKTVTQQLISKHSNVDIVIIVACGERAGEVVETLKTFPKLMDVHSDEPLMHRTVLICNTSSMPVAARESSIYVGVTIAEYFRQMSLDVLLLADSTSRWAQAMREISGRLEEMPGDEAFPAYLQSRIFSFYERAGVISLSSERGEGSVTILGAVSPAGGNMNEPVVQATQNVVGAFICLSRALSEKRIYPSIDPLLSWSTYEGRFNAELEETQVPDWGRWIYNTRQCLRDGDEIARRLEVVGEEGIPLQDMIIYLKSNFISFCYLQQNAFDKEDIYSSLDRQKVQFAFINEVLDQKFVFDTHDKARSWFLEFQTEVKNLNFLKFGSDAYKESLAFLKEKIKNKAEEPLEISHAEVL